MILFLLVDGVGVGERDPGKNPLARGDFLLSHFSDGSGARLPRGGRIGFADATLGVPGRPQSATGHAALLSGVNAAAAIGKHLLGFPNEALRRLLLERNLFRDLQAAGKRGVHANAFTCAYLDVLGLPHVHATGPEPPLPMRADRLRPAASTVAASSTGHPFHTFDHLRAGEALFHDITNELLRGKGYELPRRSPGEAAEILLDQGRRNDVALFEYFRTDQAGHAQDFEAAESALSDLDELLRRLVEGLREGEGLVVTSDHGNLEDLSIRQHTLAKVPVLGFGTAAPLAEDTRSILDIHPTLLRLAAGN